MGLWAAHGTSQSVLGAGRSIEAAALDACMHDTLWCELALDERLLLTALLATRVSKTRIHEGHSGFDPISPGHPITVQWLPHLVTRPRRATHAVAAAAKLASGCRHVSPSSAPVIVAALLHACMWAIKLGHSSSQATQIRMAAEGTGPHLTPTYPLHRAQTGRQQRAPSVPSTHGGRSGPRARDWKHHHRIEVRVWGRGDV